ASALRKGPWLMLSSRFPRARRSFRVSTTGTKPTCAALSYSNIASSAIMGVGRGLLLWLLGVPLPIIILLALFWHS
ncbi:MAG TPA: hypothetical protein VNX22_07140, partial [Acidobacteriaceae bacterium]|nr:hypothetical protein [Acidobacteriaceae bacterium]